MLSLQYKGSWMKMAVSRPVNVAPLVATAVVAVAIVFSGCHRGGGTIRRGDLSYDCAETFAADASVLALAEAAGRGDAATVRKLATTDSKANAVGKHGITPLWWAAWANNYEGFAALLEIGASPNVQRAEGLPVMHLVIRTADDDTRFLEAALKHGGDPNLRDPHTGETPLFSAILFKHSRQIDLLLGSGADVKAQNPIDDMTLLMAAMSSSANYELVYRLLERGADPKVKTKTGLTLAGLIELNAISSDNVKDPWRKKVIDLLRSKGVVVKE
jgi:ankyrin repeat protein